MQVFATRSPLATSNNEMMATFGAWDVVKYGIDIPVTFVVRAYYTRYANVADLDVSTNEAPRRIDGAQQVADGKYYVVEKTITTMLKGTDGEGQIVTAVNQAVADLRKVERVVYYNMSGAASTRPFDGVNLRVTRYTDGSVSTVKMVK